MTTLIPTTAPLPAAVSAAGVTIANDLDVRPVLAKGGDPFQLIMKSLTGLDAGKAIRLIVGFEPAPLYAIVRSLGYAWHTERDGGVVNVWFWRDAAREPAPPPGAARVPLLDPVELDVRGLEPPQPMVTILEKLSELGAGAQLIVRHHREPVLLYEKLELRGYAARTTRRPEGDFLIHIAPQWAFDETPKGRP
jgi:uncharacterized protein (DUF2249 family)